MAFTVPFYELQDFPTERYDRRGFAAIRKLMCLWNDRLTLINELTSDENNYYPYDVNAGFVAEVAVEPFSAQTQQIVQPDAEYEWALLTVRYSTELSISTAGILVETIVPALYTEPVNSAGLAWEDDTPLWPGEAPAILRSGCTYQRTRYKTMLLPPLLFAYVNCINSLRLDTTLLGVWFAPTTLMYLAPRMTRSFTMGGVTSWTIEQNFIYRYNGGLGWNGVWRMSTGQWEHYYAFGGIPVRPYWEEDLNLVLA